MCFLLIWATQLQLYGQQFIYEEKMFLELSIFFETFARYIDWKVVFFIVFTLFNVGFQHLLTSGQICHSMCLCLENRSLPHHYQVASTKSIKTITKHFHGCKTIFHDDHSQNHVNCKRFFCQSLSFIFSCEASRITWDDWNVLIT